MLIARHPLRARRHSPPRPDALYGYGYRPDWPSIVSVAHDTADGWRVLVITDRPCALANPLYPATLPLIVGGNVRCIDAQQVLPIKFRLLMNQPVARGAVWTWASGGAGLVDLATGHAANAAAGVCADTPGPYAPAPPLAGVVAASPDGSTAALTFDRPMVLTGDPPDDAFTFDDQPPTAVVNVSPTTLQFSLASSVGPGSAWAINRQPAWVATPLSVPAGGTF